jgi:hypothetical protein
MRTALKSLGKTMSLLAVSALAFTSPLSAETLVGTVTTTPSQSVILNFNDNVVSRDGRFNLVFQSDGNLVLLQNGQRIWNAGTGPRFRSTTVNFNPNLPVTFVVQGCFAAFQSDGNFVVYGAEGVVGAAPPCSNPNLTSDNALVLWSSKTDRNPGSRLEVQTDGNVVIYTPSNRAIWSTRTCCR